MLGYARLFQSLFAQPERQAVCLPLGWCKGLSLAFEKFWNYPPVTWTALPEFAAVIGSPQFFCNQQSKTAKQSILWQRQSHKWTSAVPYRFNCWNLGEQRANRQANVQYIPQLFSRFCCALFCCSYINMFSVGWVRYGNHWAHDVIKTQAVVHCIIGIYITDAMNIFSKVLTMALLIRASYRRLMRVIVTICSAIVSNPVSCYIGSHSSL